METISISGDANRIAHKEQNLIRLNYRRVNKRAEELLKNEYCIHSEPTNPFSFEGGSTIRLTWTLGSNQY